MGSVSDLAFLVGAPLWVAVLIYGIRTSKDWGSIMGRWNERQRDRATIESEQYRRIADRCTKLEVAEEKCRRELADKERRLAVLEGYNQGQGNARQEAAGITALDRLADRKNKNA